MKNRLALFILMYAAALHAQNVGINTTTPAAGLEVVNLRAGTKYFRIANSSNREFLTVTDNGVGINRTNNPSLLSLDIMVPDNAPEGMSFRVVNGSSYFGHSFNAHADATYDQASATVTNRDQGLYFSVDNDPRGGIFIGPRTNLPQGLFIGENGLNAVYGNASTPVLPRATLDVQGSIVFFSSAAPCINGSIKYDGSNLQGCVGGTWKQLNN